MARHHARSVLAALAVGVALTATGCTTGSGSSSGTSVTPAGHAAKSKAPESAGKAAQSESVAPQATKAQSADGPSGSGSRSGSNSGSGKTGPPWCTSDALSASLRSGDAAAGNRYATLVLSNTSNAACRTRGYPGLQFTGKGGKQIPTRVVRDHSHSPAQLTLAPGERASAQLHWTVVQSEGDPADGNCPVPTGLRVIPPDQRAADSTSWHLGTVCGTGKVQVLPLQAGNGPAR